MSGKAISPAALALLIAALPVAAWECREGLQVDEYNEYGMKVDVPAPVPEHVELASDILFGRPVLSRLDSGGVYVSFEIFRAFKGDLSGTVTLMLYDNTIPSMRVGWSYVITLFDGGKVDVCSMAFEMPSNIDDMEDLISHARREDYSAHNATLRELLRVLNLSP